MNEEAIACMEISDLLRSENVYMIQAQPIEVREQLKALYFARMQELKADKELKEQVKRMFKAFVHFFYNNTKHFFTNWLNNVVVTCLILV